MSQKFLAKADLGPWIERLRPDYLVFAPMLRDGFTAFRALSQGDVPVLDKIPVNSAKATVFPQTETLMRITQHKHSDDLTNLDVDISYSLAKVPRIILGARPCDARALSLTDALFNGKVKDPYYLARRERTFVVAQGCARPDNSCFCPGTGGGPYDESGVDVMLYPVADGWLLKALTPAGEKLAALANLQEPGEREAEAALLRKTAEAYLAKAPDMRGAEKAYWKLFDNEDFWEEATAGCLRCRICAYLCPVCTCFNISDEETGLDSERIRTWDHCMSYMFTQEASGHNPRSPKAYRMRNRIGHKFCFFPEQQGGTVSCTGCGRCVRSCPVGIDIREIVSAIKGQGQ